MAWPKGVKRGPRTTAVKGPIQSAAQVPIQEPLREGAVVVRGRDGETLTRKRTQSSDQFFIPDEVVPQGWSYQWNCLEVAGQPQVGQRMAMAENGWRPVPAGRHPGRFMPNGTANDAPIIRDSLILEERPIELTMEARAEEAAKARRQVLDQQEQLGLSQKLPSGFNRDNAELRRAERSKTSRTYAPAPDIARPQLPIDSNS